jgi:tetratricopeptide (TPR) repeat protein
MWRWWLGLVVAGAVPAAAQTAQRPQTLAELEAGAQRDSLDPDALYRLALRYDALKRYDDAGRVLKNLLGIDPRYAPAWLLLGYLPYDRRPKLWEEVSKDKVPPAWKDSVTEAERLFHRAFLIDPLVDFRVMGAPPPKEDVVAIPDYGDLTTVYLLYLGLSEFGFRYQLSYDALNLFVQRAFKDKPTDSIPSGLFWLRGLAAAHLNNNVRAISDIQVLLDRSLKHETSDSLIQLDLNTNDYRYLLALLKQQANRPADAMTLYQEAIANDLGLYMAHLRLARLYATVRMWPQAVEEARRAVAANPDDGSLLIDLAEVLRDAGQLAAAESTFQQAQQANTRSPRVEYELGLLEQQLNKPTEARAALTRFVAIAPSRLSTEVADAKQRLTTLQ